MSIQDVKDSFYATLRDRIATGNPARTLALRGVLRPAVVVAENELHAPAVPQPDTFSIVWTGLRTDPLGLLTATCELVYATAGSTGLAGMDRGRALAAMDQELRAALTQTPQSAAQIAVAEIAGGGASTNTATGTQIFWTDPVFAPATSKAERIQRTATVEVFGYV